MEEQRFEEKISMPEGCTAQATRGALTVRGPKGEITKKLIDKKIKVDIKGNEVILSYPKGRKKEKKNMNTMSAHVRNMLKGVTEGFNYKLKICSGHFPMTVTLKNDVFEIKNFIGEKVPRKLTVKQGVTVKVSGDIIDVEGVDKELAGQTAASIEKMTRRPGFDKRIFQDGIYIIEKDGKKLSH